MVRERNNDKKHTLSISFAILDLKKFSIYSINFVLKMMRRFNIVTIKGFEEILKYSTASNSDVLSKKDKPVILQWDPDHNPDFSKPQKII
ncbi:hypothetical protein BpHYR1_013130 [Brachionus plicatilis]|uniref:Uncharacterized protein n=1 Tax=Brachionus plicatilis TaxID=10195 RepID=A0A3M7Q857_BRAPC|nr:hypothetical protein BpHYR1_013130 [Brachionus plicatilis]